MSREQAQSTQNGYSRSAFLSLMAVGRLSFLANCTQIKVHQSYLLPLFLGGAQSRNIMECYF